jgi:4'-phosphopantetheinyl transferase
VTKSDKTVRPVIVWAIDWRELSARQRGVIDAALTGEDRDRATNFRQSDDVTRFCVGRGLLRILSAQYFGVTAATLDLRLQPRGKPYWNGPPHPLGVNLSHSGDWIYIVLVPEADVGIDIQSIRSGVDMTGVMGIAMHPAEEEQFSSIGNETSRTAFFYNLWTLREAALKTTGDGFFALRESLNTLPVPDRLVWARRKFGAHQDVDLILLPAPDGYACAVGLAGRNTKFPPALPIMLWRNDLMLD